MLVIFGFSSLNSQQIPNLGGLDTIFKKSAHAVGYALLALAYLRGIGLRRRWALPIAWFLAIVYAFSDEFHQSFVSGRGARVTDVMIDSIGALIGLVIYRLSVYPTFSTTHWARLFLKVLTYPDEASFPSTAVD